MPKAVREFIVVPPADRVEELVADAERFDAHLHENFPGYSFSMSPVSPFGSDTFQVIPMLGTAGDAKNPGTLAPQPERWVLDDIIQVCRRFDVGASKRRDS